MAKHKEEKTNVMRILDQKSIAYTPHTYPVGDTAPDGVSVAAMMGQDILRSGLLTLCCWHLAGCLPYGECFICVCTKRKKRERESEGRKSEGEKGEGGREGGEKP